ncbi:MAG: linear amide C-N hydrolase [Duncaniella sp.]|nr:linear amide C-N hydrolase [Bacteroides sp.]MBD5300353.1 linear amide C-N hydrolase [Bacteroides sp.]MBD5318425.1 linear amide C-N hydrolase [Bacteroides sp.]MBD5355039.1 linear amide C-N hydrolase [Bacteroides sp.]MDE7475441.1 linear amide C-N hydrolase [Duncaniella sp.]
MKAKLIAAAMALVAMAGFNNTAEGCSRVLYVGNDSLRIVGRSLDWKTPIPTNLYVYPRGMHKQGNSIPGSVEWTSKYGAVYAVGYDGGVTEGMNEKGLVVNGLFCKGTIYVNDSTMNRPPMSLAMFPAWVLDLCANTPEAVELIGKHDFNISGATFDGGTVSTLHWGITDKEGRSAIVEFDKGTIRIYQGQDIPVLTNDPTFPQMNAINDYWVKKGGTHTLPGTVSSPDRFVRGYFFDHNVEKTADADLGFSIIRSILFNVSVPYTYTVEGEGNVSSTQWRSFANIRDLRYYFDVVTNPGAFYIDLNKCDLRPGASVMKIDTSKSSDFVGDVTSKLFKTKPFTPMY